MPRFWPFLFLFFSILGLVEPERWDWSWFGPNSMQNNCSCLFDLSRSCIQKRILWLHSLTLWLFDSILWLHSNKRKTSTNITKFLKDLHTADRCIIHLNLYLKWDQSQDSSSIHLEKFYAKNERKGSKSRYWKLWYSHYYHT